MVKAEIVKIARRFGVNENAALDLAFCESGYNNLAANKYSSALGIFQYINGTWENTNSWKVYHRSPTEFKANIWEAILKLSNKEYSHWSECYAEWLFETKYK